jgi:hypothetical protein
MLRIAALAPMRIKRIRPQRFTLPEHVGLELDVGEFRIRQKSAAVRSKALHRALFGDGDLDALGRRCCAACEECGHDERHDERRHPHGVGKG